MNVIINGDAVFIIDGIVTEFIILLHLNEYKVVDTLNVIANNLVGFTTDSSYARSTRYASDLAKGYEIPIIRVNADDPIACVRAIGMAYEYTKKFHKDCLLDLVGYR